MLGRRRASRAPPSDATAQARAHYEIGPPAVRRARARAGADRVRSGQRAEAAPGRGVHDGPVRVPAGPAQGRARPLPGLHRARARRASSSSWPRTGSRASTSARARSSSTPCPTTSTCASRSDGATRRAPPVDRPGRRPTTSRCRAAATASTSSKTNYRAQTRIVDVDIAETKPLFFKLEPDPGAPGDRDRSARRHAVRERQPRAQPLPPGRRRPAASRSSPRRPTTRRATIDFTLAPGERKLLTGPERVSADVHATSGRPELIVASAIMGGFVGAGAVAAAIGKRPRRQNVASVLLATGGGAGRRDRRRAGRDAARPRLHPRQPGAVHHRRRCGSAPPRERDRASSWSADDHSARTRDAGCAAARSLSQVRSAISCGPVSSAAFPGWRWA